MINHYMEIQKKINYYSCYIKNLIYSLCTEFQTDRVHIRRITPVLVRLLVNENESFIRFFNYEKIGIEMQLIRYVTQLGEIIHVGEGYYTLPPERAVQMPDGRFIVVSSLKPSVNTSFGIGLLPEKLPEITLSYQQFLHRPTSDEILNIYSNRLSKNPDIVPTEMIYFNSTGIVKTKRIINMREGVFYILFFERSFRHSTKLERYFARWQNNEWFVAEIKSTSHYLRLRLALGSISKQVYTYKINYLNKDCLELKFKVILPEEEHRLLRLIATPEHNKWPRRYVFSIVQLRSIEKILSCCNLIREEL
ncbi:hypothetical protein [Sporosarcina highlanderae]|uniref:WYL domain-containing protein n=1 Tax=Sporosarcina highlanderae TaxID=3035916 RepID=A0ABT8JQU9_9BACL|nr:hypothetical protein [Sporosarcina highlanderae]MDN4607168.1 hypothetical protein [Sporosarcina highlanderae]